MATDLGRNYSIRKWVKSIHNDPPELNWRMAFKNTALVVAWLLFMDLSKSCNTARFSVKEITLYSEEYYGQLLKEVIVIPSKRGDGYFVEYRQLPDVPFTVATAGIVGFLVFLLSALSKTSKSENEL